MAEEKLFIEASEEDVPVHYRPAAKNLGYHIPRRPTPTV